MLECVTALLGIWKCQRVSDVLMGVTIQTGHGIHLRMEFVVLNALWPAVRTGVLPSSGNVSVENHEVFFEEQWNFSKVSSVQWRKSMRWLLGQSSKPRQSHWCAWPGMHSRERGFVTAVTCKAWAEEVAFLKAPGRARLLKQQDCWPAVPALFTVCQNVIYYYFFLQPVTENRKK